MKSDLSDLKKLVVELLHQADNGVKLTTDQSSYVNRMYNEMEVRVEGKNHGHQLPQNTNHSQENTQQTEDQTTENETNFESHIEVIESLSLEDREKELILKALDRHKGRRKNAALELGISERTLYRKINEYELKV
jgi:DNA-binding NtrC family response regulator